jgi:uncharacterized protein (TIGR02757 family)
MNKRQLKEFLDKKVDLYNQPSFIAADPISIPHLFTKKQDIEIAGFFAAIFAWGNRTTIINKAKELMQLMDMAPYEFIRNYNEKDLKGLLEFKHRTFNDTDLLYFIEFFRHHYGKHKSLEAAFVSHPLPFSAGLERISPPHMETVLKNFYRYFFSLEDIPERTRKHIATPERNSTCKRLNMFLRWMVRSDEKGVDFGIWKNISPAQLICPLDVHVARVARQLGILKRKQNDWETALELTGFLRTLDKDDPVKYDFALFGLGAIEPKLSVIN